MLCYRVYQSRQFRSCTGLGAAVRFPCQSGRVPSRRDLWCFSVYPRVISALPAAACCIRAECQLDDDIHTRLVDYAFIRPTACSFPCPPWTRPLRFPDFRITCTRMRTRVLNITMYDVFQLTRPRNPISAQQIVSAACVRLVNVARLMFAVTDMRKNAHPYKWTSDRDDLWSNNNAPY